MLFSLPLIYIYRQLPINTPESSLHFSTSLRNPDPIFSPFSLLSFHFLAFDVIIHSKIQSFMARFGSFVLIFLVMFASVVPSLEARKLLNKESNNMKVPSLFKSLVLSALPKGKVPASSPSKKTHATLDNEQLFARHLASIDRILRSVPSPGIGH